MSFLGNNPSRSETKNRDLINGDRAPRSEAIFLGEASKVAGPPPAQRLEEPAPTFASEPRTFGQAGPTAPEKCTNVIAAGAKWKGTLTVEDSVRVEGVFAGEIQTKGTVHVMDGAQVDAKIRAAFVLISGSFQGEIRCEQRVDLLPRARVSGEIYTRGFTCQEGARLDARVQMSGGAEAETPRAGRTARTATIDEPLTSRAAAAAAANSRSIDE